MGSRWKKSQAAREWVEKQKHPGQSVAVAIFFLAILYAIIKLIK